VAGRRPGVSGICGAPEEAGDSSTLRILADFVIGAHAQQGGYQLPTLDDRLYGAGFPNLTVLSI